MIENCNRASEMPYTNGYSRGTPKLLSPAPKAWTQNSIIRAIDETLQAMSCTDTERTNTMGEHTEE